MSDHSRSLDNVSRQSMASSTAYHCPEVVEWVKYGSVLPLSTALSKLVSRTQADIWAFGAIMYVGNTPLLIFWCVYLLVWIFACLPACMFVCVPVYVPACVFLHLSRFTPPKP